ncbi:MAG: acetyl-CoA hydrolase/transferase family protein [Bacteroidetes bacterium]|nr:acetyl-CoA hydrolase/transferase family protein [Bacteroidota bacterium]MBK7431634.1 acetyl-CoA hydrolase/transferase family protein [Bacteroidota bacterium]MBK7572883.1 acetyl-CoA hydrolase/transferase family protein [Bacteroidota bacterium]
MLQYTSAESAIKLIQSNERVFIHGGAATPRLFVEALTNRHSELRNVEIVHIHTEGEATYAKPEYKDSFFVNSFFIGGNLRSYVDSVNVQYVPVFLSEIPALFRKGVMPLDTALIQVSMPDQHGFCSLGPSVDIAKAATDVAKKIIALVNPNMPRSHGDGQIHVSHFSAVTYCEEPIYELLQSDATDIELAIGKNIAGIIENGATLQMGIGGIPNAVLKCLGNHKDLGIHTEMFSDGILPLVEKGIINGRMKKRHPGKIVSAFAMGTRKLYDFINDNPMVAMLDVAYVNDTAVIRKNDKMTAINSAVEIDLSGQVCSDSIGSRIISGVGGQMDFIRGASLSKGGKPIIAIASATAKGVSKIVPILKPGAGVVTTRAHVHFVVTEFGVADLYGKNIAQRAKSLISIAHPDHREELERNAHEFYG